MHSGVVTPTSVSQFAGGYNTHQIGLSLSSNTSSYIKIVLALVILGSFLLRSFSSSSRKLSSSYGTRIKRQLEHDNLSLSESLVEGIMVLATKMCLRIAAIVAANTRSVLTFRMLPRQFVLAHPSMERALDKHAEDTSLADNMVLVGRQMFNLSDKTVDVLFEHNARPNLKRDFSGFENSRALLEAASSCALHRLGGQPDMHEAQLGIWLFKLTSSAVATAIWGPENPWVLSEDFANRFIAFTYALPTLLRPFPQITAPRAVQARDDVLVHLRSFHAQHRDQRIRQLAHRINLVTMADPSWESNPDYFHVELLVAQGLVVTPSAIVTWLVRHLLCSGHLLQRVVAELRGIGELDGKLDVDHVRRACPTLVASLHETLRLHMTAIPRVAKTDFDLPTPDAQQLLQIRRGDLINLPMSSFNKNPATWGPDCESFNPHRFIAKDGSVSASAVRKLRVFGVAGNMCPGRKFGFDIVLFIAAMVLRNFDFELVGGDGETKGFPLPLAAEEPGIGFERVGDDVMVKIKRV